MIVGSRCQISTTPEPSRAARASRSVEKDHVCRQGQLILHGAQIVGRRIVGVLVPQLGSNQAGVLAPCIEPVTPTHAVSAVFCLRSRPLAAGVIEILVAYDQIIALRYLEILIIHNRPSGCITDDLTERANR